MTSRSLLLGTLLALAACESSSEPLLDAGVGVDAGVADAGVARRICDGSSRLVLFARMVSAGLPPLQGSEFVARNGRFLLLVRGDCEVFFEVFAEPGVYAHVHLSPPQEDDLIEALHYSEWPELYGDWLPPAGEFEGTDLILSDRGGTIACRRSCNGTGAERAHAIWLNYNAVLTELRAGSERLDSALLLKLVRPATALPEFFPAAPWPATTSSSIFLLEEAEASGAPPFVMPAGEDAQRLRQLQGQFENGDFGSWNESYIPIAVPDDVDSPKYRLFTSDVMPFEDEAGQIRFDP